MELFKRFPKFRLLLKDEPIVPGDVRSNYPSFAADFEILDKELLPLFQTLDKEASIQQNSYRWTYVILIFGGSLATILGIAQLAFLDASWIGLVEALVSAVVTATTALQSRKQHERYMNARLAAERLRSEYFLFLGHFAQYANDQDRVQKLIQHVAEIKVKGENDNTVWQPTEAKLPGESARINVKLSDQLNNDQFFQLYNKYRYEDQRKFYDGRRDEFEKAQTQAIWISIGSMFLAAVVGVIEQFNIPWLKLTCLLLAAIFPVLSTTIAAYSTLYGFEQQAKLYQDTINALLQAHAFSPDLRSGLSKTEFAQALDKYVHEVEQVFLIEQGQWGQLAKKMKRPE